MTTPQNPRSIDAIIDSLDGGPAFPVAFDVNPDGNQSGMRLRDWFAGMAMPAVCLEAVGELSESQIASDAYRIADAMLAARKGVV